MAACIQNKDVDGHSTVGKEQEVLMVVKKKKRSMHCKNMARPKCSKLSSLIIPSSEPKLVVTDPAFPNG